MNNILLSQIFESKTCFNCNTNINNAYYCNCEYLCTYNIDIYFSKFSHRICIEKFKNIYNINIENNQIYNFKQINFTVNNISLQELFDKIETYLIFQ